MQNKNNKTIKRIKKTIIAALFVFLLVDFFLFCLQSVYLNKKSLILITFKHLHNIHFYRSLQKNKLYYSRDT